MMKWVLLILLLAFPLHEGIAETPAEKGLAIALEVDERRERVFVAELVLDVLQVRAVRPHARGVAVPEGVRVKAALHADLPTQPAQEVANVARVHPPPLQRGEQRPPRVDPVLAPTVEPPLHVRHRHREQERGARLVALPVADADRERVEIHVARPERKRLADPCAASVEQRQERRVPHPSRGATAARPDQLQHLGLVEDLDLQLRLLRHSGHPLGTHFSVQTARRV